MELSIALSVPQGVISLSSDAEYVAIGNGRRLEVRSVETVELLHATECATRVSNISWGRLPVRTSSSSPSCNIAIVGAACTDSSSIAIVRADNGSIVADISVGALGLQSISLSNHGYLLAHLASGVGASLFNIQSATAICTFPHARHGQDRAAWSACGKRIFINGSLHLTSNGVAQCELQKQPCFAKFACVNTTGALLAWGDCGGGAYDAHGRLLGKESGETVAEEEDTTCTRTSNACVRIRSADMDCTGRLGALGGADGYIRIIDVRSGMEISGCSLTQPEFDAANPALFYVERRKGKADADPRFELMQADGARVEVERIRSITEKDRDAVLMCRFDTSATMLAATGGAARNVVYVWNVRYCRLDAALVLKCVPRDVKWTEKENGQVLLIVVGGGDCVYTWEKKGAAVVRVEHSGKKDVQLNKVLVGNEAGGKGKAVVVDAANMNSARIAVVLYV